jgi:hypothetical protein
LKLWIGDELRREKGGYILFLRGRLWNQELAAHGRAHVTLDLLQMERGTDGDHGF